MVLAAGLPLASCAPPEPAPWPEEDLPEAYDTTVLQPDVTVASQVLSNCVTVEEDRLVFPANDLTAVVNDWPVGSAVIADRRMNSDEPGNNVFGFMRKVREVRTEGDQVIVDTEPASVRDVLTGGALQFADFANATPVELGDLNPDDYFKSPAPEGELYDDIDGEAQLQLGPASVITSELLGAEVDISREFNISGSATAFNMEHEFVVGQGTNGEATVRVIGDVSVGAAMQFSPSAWLEFEVDLDVSFDDPVDLSFGAGLQGPLSTTATTRFDLDLVVLSGSTSELEQALLDAEHQSGSALSIVLAKGKPMVGPNIGPVPTTFRNELTLDCWYKVRGGMKGETSLTTSVDPLTAAVYWDDDDGFTIVRNNLFSSVNIDGSGHVQGAADATLECGLMPRVKWLIGDVGGPYVGVRGSLAAHGTFEETCPAQGPHTVQADTTTSVELTSRMQVLLGGEVDVSILGQGFNLGIGPWDVYNTYFGTVWEDEWTFEGQGWSQCQGTCDDGVVGQNETDVDCGGADCAPCGVGAVCTFREDCASTVCSINGVCVGGTCFDGVQNGDETYPDCGGSCAATCFEGAACNDNSDCTSGICGALGVCRAHYCEDNRQNGAETGIDCGGNCWRKCGAGSSCNSGADCDTGVCSSTGTCIDDACFDGFLSDGETDVDCGGPNCAARCALGVGCSDGTDCASGICSASGVCVDDTCADGFFSPGEMSVDCGGVCDAKCSSGARCEDAEDCQSAICSAVTQTCVPDLCSDGVLGQNETSTDCGGPDCKACFLGKRCVVDDDCYGDAICSQGANPRCVADTCHDEVLTTGETDVDCGGTCNAKCRTGASCVDADDCASALCSPTTNRCVSDRCEDAVRNGTESDVDCGGDCQALCAVDAACNTNADCASGVCNLFSRTCVVDTCFDGLRSGDETDVDCGGSCAANCVSGQDCADGGDCESGLCNVDNLECVDDSCFDGVLTSGESDVDCGGVCARGCGLGQACSVGGDCASDECLPDNTCTVDPCSDGVQNGDESDVDCGGSCATGCVVDQACTTPDDCASGYCSVSTGLCVDDHCIDGRVSADESDVDCGGADCTGCEYGESCNLASDCRYASYGCQIDTNVCVQHYEDGVLSGDETDVDCGGNSGAPRCVAGAGCSVSTDCDRGGGPDTGSCISDVCQTPLPRDCYQAYIYFGLSTSGATLLRPTPTLASTYSMYCDQTPASWGWTLIGTASAGLIDRNPHANKNNFFSFAIDTSVLSGSRDELSHAPWETPHGLMWVERHRFMQHAGTPSNPDIRYTVHQGDGTVVFDTHDPNFYTPLNLSDWRNISQGQYVNSPFWDMCLADEDANEIDFGCNQNDFRISMLNQSSPIAPSPRGAYVDMPDNCYTAGTCHGYIQAYANDGNTFWTVNFGSGAGPNNLILSAWVR